MFCAVSFILEWDFVDVPKFLGNEKRVFAKMQATIFPHELSAIGATLRNVMQRGARCIVSISIDRYFMPRKLAKKITISTRINNECDLWTGEVGKLSSGC